jgi:transcriptional regulator NrdR family protein
VQSGKHVEAFQRDKLLLDVYDSLRHRKTAISDATALTDTIQKQLLPFVEQASLPVEAITEVTALTLENFDPIAATHFRAFHS